MKKRKRKREQSNSPYTSAGSRQPTAAPKNKRSRQQERTSRWQRDEAARRQIYEDSAPSSSSFSMETLPHPPPSLPADTSSMSSSDWVNSMAKIADPLQGLLPIPWEFLVPPPNWTPQPLHPQTWPVQPVSTLPEKPIQASSSSNSAADLPKKPPPTNNIGMPPARDPEGKRGGFKLSSTTVFESKPHITYPHSPDPRQTLILDQLPKLCRTPQWLKSWSRSACGAQPVFLAVDSSSAKALLEFAAADHAEKAWASPKLGKGISHLSSTQLKGKSREDLIRVWWYRASSPEQLVFSRKELEEGEIEDDESMVDGRKESKKEKRARLAKLEKEKQRSTESHRNDEIKISPLSSVPSSYEASSTAPTSYIQPFHTDASPPSASMTWQLPTTSYIPSVLPAPLRSQSSLPLEPQSSPAPLPVIPGIWHRPPSLNAFMGPLPSQYYTHLPKLMSIDNLAENHADDIDMELSSPTLHSPSVDLFEQEVTVTDEPSAIEEDSNTSSCASSATVSPAPAEEDRVYNPSSPPESPPGLCASPNLHMSQDMLPATSQPESTVVKAPPVEPSFVRRTLLARQKELEERIARSKLELERKQSDAITTIRQQTPAPSHSELTSSPPPSSLNPVSENTSDKQVMEDRLRSLVLASKRKRQKLDVSVTIQPASETADDSARASGAVVPDPLHSDTSSGTRTPSTIVDSALDDLAVSFIQESIQTTKPTPLPTQVSAPPLKPSSSSSSVGLAARREQLEYQITETKRLMELLSQATTKQGKDSIMTQIRELNRCVCRINLFRLS